MRALWGFLWDAIGHIHDYWPRWAKITIALLILATVGFFFGYRTAIYVAGGALWISFGFMFVAHLVILTRNLRADRAPKPAPLTPTDQEDIEEFQAAMQASATPPQKRA